MSAPALVACAVAALTLAVPVVAATGSLTAVHRATGAADAAALAAADAAAGWVEAEPCQLATRVVTAADAELVRCDLDPGSGQVRVSVCVQTLFGVAYVRARAGPPVA